MFNYKITILFGTTHSIRIHNLVNVSVWKSPQKLVNCPMHQDSKNQETQSHQTQQAVVDRKIKIFWQENHII